MTGRQALEMIPRRIKDASRPGSRTTGSTSSGDGRTKTKTADGDSRTGPVEGIAQTLYSIRNAAKSLSPREIREGLETVAQEAENVVSRCMAHMLLRSVFFYIFADLQVSTGADEIRYGMAANKPLRRY